MKATPSIVGLVLIFLLASACGNDGGSGSAGKTGPGSPLVCEPGTGVVDDRCAPAGFEECLDGTGPDGAPCGQAAGSCAPGTVAFFGRKDCTPLGPSSCPEGFDRHPSGFGCVPILPASECTGATRPRLGEKACVPVGDCNAAFPPAGATYFVDDSYTAGQLDATHYRQIQDAVGAAPSGAVIAIEEGSYTGSVILTRAVTLVGRCPSKVTLSGAGALTAGFDLEQKVTVGLRGLTVTDFLVGVSAGGAATLNLEGLVFDANRKIGISAADAGTTINAKALVVRGTLPDGSARFGYGVASGFDAVINVDDSALLHSGEMGATAQKSGVVNLTRSVISSVAQRSGSGGYGWGIGTLSSGQATATESAILDTFSGGIVAGEADTKVSLVRSYVHGVQAGPSPTGGKVAAGALVQQKGAVLEVDGSTIADSALDGIFVTLGGRATITSSVVRDLTGSSIEASGITITTGSSATVKSSVIMASTGAGILSDGTLEADDLSVTDVAVGALVVRGTAKVNGFVATNLRLATDQATGDPYGTAVYVDQKGSLDLTDVIVRGAVGIGVQAQDPGTKLTLTRAAITEMKAAGDGGFGLVCINGAEVTVENAAVTKAADSAVYVVDPGTNVTLRGVSIIDTQPGPTTRRGRSVNVQNGAAVTLERVRTSGGMEVGLDVFGDGTSVVALDSIFTSVGTTDRGYGHGVTVIEGASLVMRHSISSAHANTGIVFANASGSVASSIIKSNPVGIQTLDGVTLIEAPTAPDELTPLSAVITADTRFEDNQTKVGSGEIPLPPAFDLPKHR